MNGHKALVALLILLALEGCAPMGAKPEQAPSAPYSPENDDSMQGGGGGSGSGSM